MVNPLEQYGVSDIEYSLSCDIMQDISPVFDKIDAHREMNQLKVLQAFRDARFSDTHFAFSSGYGYDDLGREKIESMYSQIFGGESAHVRIQISAGTQAIAAGLFGILRPGDELLSVTGRPYDTLASVIGIDDQNKNAGSLRDFGISYREVNLLSNGCPDIEGIKNAIKPNTRIVFIQKSKGYTTRRCLLKKDIEQIVRGVREKSSSTVIFVDNCYGEFVEQEEPCALGADLCAGSLIKNPGGGLAPSGGYLTGKTEYVELAASRLTAPGLGSHVGPSLGFNKAIAQGLYMAPHITAECLKGAVFAAKLFAHKGYRPAPLWDEERGDIVQSITFSSANQIIAFCTAVQSCSPVDSFVQPEPWEMPGYDVPVIMAAGAFTQGSSIELSADAPIREPYTAYMQGGLVFEQVKLAALLSVEKMKEYL